MGDPVCSRCGEGVSNPFEYDEATELCADCFEWTFDEPLSQEPDHAR